MKNANKEFMKKDNIVNYIKDNLDEINKIRKFFTHICIVDTPSPENPNKMHQPLIMMITNTIVVKLNIELQPRATRDEYSIDITIFNRYGTITKHTFKVETTVLIYSDNEDETIFSCNINEVICAIDKYIACFIKI